MTDLPNPGARTAAIAAAIAVVALAALGGTLGHGFVWDDRFLILEDPGIRRLADLPGVFTRSMWSFTERPVAIDFYRPLQNVSLAVERALWGTRAAGYHAVNLALYLATSLLMFAAARRLMRADVPAALTAALFAAHPIHVEAVAFVSNRGDLLASFLALGSLVLVLGRTDAERAASRTARAAAAVALYAAALFSKEVAVAFLPVLITASLWPPEQAGQSKRRPSAAGLPLTLAFVGCAAAFWSLRLAVLRGTPGGSVELAPEPALTLRLLGKYLGLLAYPHPLNASPDLASGGLALSPAQAAGTVILLGLLATGLAIGTRRGVVLLGLGWFLATLSPVLHFVSGSITLAERYVYLPSGGLFLAVVASGLGILERKRLPASWGRASLAAGAAAVVVLTAVARERSAVWHDEESLWSDTARRSPARYSVAGHLAEALHASRGEQAAFASLAQFLEQRRAEGFPKSAADIRGPDGPAEAQEAALLVARYVDLLLGRGRLQEAERWLTSLAAIDPYSSETFFLKGTLALLQGREREAVADLTTALALDPRDTYARFNRGLAYERSGERERAARDYREVLAAAPDHQQAAAHLAALEGRPHQP